MMMKNRTARPFVSLLGGTAALSVFLVACGGGSSPPIDEKVATEQTPGYVEALLHETGAALAFTTSDDGTLRKVMGSGSSTAKSVMSSGMTAASADMPPTAMLRALVGPRVTNQMVGLELPSMMTPEEKFDETGKELRRLMQERLFVDTNFESMTHDAVTYILHPDPTCRPLSKDTDPPGTVPAIDQKCADDLTQVEVRIVVTNDGDGARFRILIGPSRFELIVFVVHSDELAVELDLPQAKSATDYIRQQIPDGNPTGSYDRLAGKLRTSVKKLGPAHATFSFGLLQSLDVAPAGGSEFTSAASNPLFAITGDGTARTAEVVLGLGATSVATTWDPHDTGVANHDLHVNLGGVYGTFSVDDSGQQVMLHDVGLGETKIVVRSSTIFDLNLNADAMRRFSGKVSVNADGGARWELTPKFDLSLALDYNAIASDLASAPDPAIAHETYRATLVNAGAAVVFEEVKSTATFGGGLRVVSGTLTLGAAGAPADTVTVPAGQCLVSRNPAPTGSNAFLGQLMAGPCQ